MQIYRRLIKLFIFPNFIGVCVLKLTWIKSCWAFFSPSSKNQLFFEHFTLFFYLIHLLLLFIILRFAPIKERFHGNQQSKLSVSNLFWNRNMLMPFYIRTASSSPKRPWVPWKVFLNRIFLSVSTKTTVFKEFQGELINYTHSFLPV